MSCEYQLVRSKVQDIFQRFNELSLNVWYKYFNEVDGQKIWSELGTDYDRAVLVCQTYLDNKIDLNTFYERLNALNLGKYCTDLKEYLTIDEISDDDHGSEGYFSEEPENDSEEELKTEE